ncbi:MAG: extracellular solute-binding protein [Ruminococcus sp.]|nr:extracellular solute-binding protein [Ruminococcus sp.]
MKNSRRTIAGLMAFAMMLSLASCGEKDSISSGDSSSAANKTSQSGENSSVTADALAMKAFKAIEIENDIPFNYIDAIRPLNDAAGEKLLITGSNDEGSVMYITDREFLNFTPVEFKVDADEDADTYYSAIPQSDGSIFVFVSITTYGDFEKPDWDDPEFDNENFDWEAYNDAAESTYKVVNIDNEGIVISENEVTGIDKYIDEDDGFYLGSLYGCGTGAIMRLSSKDYGEEMLVSVGVDGVIGDKIEFNDDDDIYSIYTNTMDKDGNLCYCTWGENGNIIKKIDSSTMTVSDDVIEIDSEDFDYVNSIYTGSGDYDFYVSNSSSLYGLKADGTLDEVINWFDSDLNGNYINALFPLDNGEFVMYERNWQTNTSGFYRLTKRDASEMENVQVITMVMQYEDSNITEKVNQFNKANDKYRIKMENYDKYYEWDENSSTQINSPENQLKLDIAAGKSFDIICMNGNTTLFTNLGKKGALLDLYELMGKDGTVSKDDILPNILTAGEIDGKLVSISPSFSVTTFAAKKKFCDKENWTLDDMIETFDSMPDDMRLFKYTQDRSDTFQQFAITGGFIDYENAKCSFDSEECLKLLEFCNGLEDSESPDYDSMTDDEWQAYYEERELAIRNDKALIDDCSIYSLREYARIKHGEFNEDMCLVGVPSNDGNGASVSTNTNFAIMANSENKDAAWEFINQFFTDDYQTSDRLYDIPSLKSAFTKKIDETMERPYWTDENGKKQEYDDSYYIGGESIKISPLSKEERDELEAYILSAKPTGWAYNQDIFNIVSEESKAYFNGERSAKETLDLIQSRCSIILSEQF